jgi:hypothetical protein
MMFEVVLHVSSVLFDTHLTAFVEYEPHFSVLTFPLHSPAYVVEGQRRPSCEQTAPS